MDEYVHFFELYKNDTIFSTINKNFISLQDEAIKENNQHLQRIVTEGLIPILKENDYLFKEVYKKIKYAGSFYKGTKVGKPNEYDLDLIVQLPLDYASLELETEHEHHGYVKIKIKENDKLPQWGKHSKVLNTWIDCDGYLDQDKFRQWMESVMGKTFNKLPKNGKDFELTVDNVTYVLKRFSKSGPAFTLYIGLKEDPVKNKIMSVDIVPSLEFSSRRLMNYKFIPGMAQKFVVIPKPLTRVMINGNNLWRLSFYDQEKQILSEKEFTKMKPVIRMLKKLRDKQKMTTITSYFIETLCLHEISLRKLDVQFLRGPLTGLFIFMLRRLYEVICAKSLPFFWHEEYNLLSNIDKPDVMENNSNRISNILTDIKKKYAENSLVIAEYILTTEEFKNLKQLVSCSNDNLIEEKVAVLDCPSPSTNSEPIPAEEPSVVISNSADANFDAKKIADQLIKIHNLDEWDSVKIDPIISSLEDKFTPDKVEMIRNVVKSYFLTKDTCDHWVPIVRLGCETLCPPDNPIHTALMTLVLYREAKRAIKNKE